MQRSMYPAVCSELVSRSTSLFSPHVRPRKICDIWFTTASKAESGGHYQALLSAVDVAELAAADTGWKPASDSVLATSTDSVLGLMPNGKVRMCMSTGGRPEEIHGQTRVTFGSAFTDTPVESIIWLASGLVGEVMGRSRDGDNKSHRLIVGVKDAGVFSYISKAPYGQKVRSAGNKFVIYSTTPQLEPTSRPESQKTSKPGWRPTFAR